MVQIMLQGRLRYTVKVRKSNSKILGFKGVREDPLSFRKGRKCGYIARNMDKYVCHVISLVPWQNATVLLKRRRIRE